MKPLHGTLRSRLAAIGLLLLMLGGGYLLLARPLLLYYEDNQRELELLGKQLDGYQRIANSRGQIEQLFNSIRPKDETLGYYLKGSTQALASAELQAYARTVIEAVQGNLVSTQPIVKAEREPERMVRVSVRMTGTIDTLLQVLFRVSSGSPLLLADELLIRPDKSLLSPAEGAQEDDVLDIQFTLTGFVKESIS